MPSKKFPQELWLLMIPSFDIQSLGRLACTSRYFYQFLLLSKESEIFIWKRLTLYYFPYFFWLSEGTERCPCRDCTSKKDHPYWPLGLLWKDRFSMIYGGKWTGLMHVLSTLRDRDMSAFLALATFDKKKKVFRLSYSFQMIARYRNGERILLDESSDMVDEELSLDAFHRFRRIPLAILEEDPRSLHSSSIFSLPLSSDGRPFLKPGTEVEMQWRMTRFNEYSWWRGIVVSSYIRPNLLFRVSLASDLENVPFETEMRDEGVLIEFSHFPINSSWRFVVVSQFGLEVENRGLGFNGGIRVVSCLFHQRQWSTLFDLTMNRINAQASLELDDQIEDLENVDVDVDVDDD